MNKDDGYQIILTPREFIMSQNDWHVTVLAPNGDKMVRSSYYKFYAKVLARRMVRRHKRGKHKDDRHVEQYRL